MRADFSTWDRATLEQFAQEATDKLVEQGEPVAWMHPITGAVVKADMKIPGVTLDDFTISLYTSALSIPEGWHIVNSQSLLEAMAMFVPHDCYAEMEAMLAAAPNHTKEEE